ncbi:MAG: pilus assembly protein [Beijerinckiaceae bacterium]|nr:pilus assembly protein [Beijerinckiaceae bacterium]
MASAASSTVSSIRRAASRGLRRMLALSGRFRAHAAGVAAVEFALILPFMFMLYIGVVELTQYIAADRKSTLFSRTLSDLAAQPIPDQQLNVPTSQLPVFDDTSRTSVFSFAAAVLYPFSATNAAMRLTQFAIDNNNGAPRAFVDWQETCTWQSNGTCLYGTNSLFAAPNTRCQTDATVDAGLLTPSTYLIRAEVSFHYDPVLPGLFSSGKTGTKGYFDFFDADGVQLKNVTYARPRSNGPIIRKYSDGSSTLKKANGTTANDAPTVCAGFKP